MRSRLMLGVLVAVACGFAAGTANPAAAQQDNIYGISAASLQNQATQVGTAFGENMQALVFHLDRSGPAPGIQVTFTAPASGPSGTFASTGTNTVTTTSGSNGIATAPTFTANDQVGSFSVTVSAPLANPYFFFFTNAEDPASRAFSISVGNGSNQAAQINTTFAIQMSVTVFNGSGAQLPGVEVVFAAPSSGPSGSFPGGQQATVATGSTGQAVAPQFTANGEVGTYFVTATVDGSQTTDGNPLSESFALRNSLNNPIGVPEIVSASAGNAQQTPVLTPFNVNLQVVVLDGSQNHVQGAQVVFTAPDTGPSGTFAGGGTSFTTTSGATGLATAPTFTANEIAGFYGVAVTATKDGVTAQTTLGLTNGRVQTTTALQVEPSGSSLQGQTVILTATVSPTAGTLVPSADVAFTDNGTTITDCATVAPSGGIASCQLNDPPTGDHLFQALYAGDAVSQPSQSAEVAHEVIPVVPPTFTKGFAPVSILPGELSTLTFTIDNTANTVEVPDLAFTDNLPAGVTVAATPDATTDCTGGTLTADAGSGVIAYTGGTVPAGASCTITVDVTATDSGQHDNTTSDLTSAAGSSGPATATLEVATVAKLFAVQAATGTGQITGAISGGGPACGVDDAEALDVTAVAASGPDGVELPHGLIGLTLTNCQPGASVDVTLTLPTPPNQQAAYWKFGPTANQPGTNAWYSITPTALAGDQLTFTLVDGGPGDSDLQDNGVIVDPGGPGQPEQVDPPPTTTTTTTTAVTTTTAAPPDGSDPGEPVAPGPTTSTTPGTDDPDAASTTTQPPAPGGTTGDPDGGGSDGSNGNGELPATGAAAATVTTSALVVLLTGAALLAATRRRRPTT